jgi:hypothetical protein
MKIRFLAAVAALVSAGVHLELWSTGMRYVQTIGPAFMVNAVAGAAIALLLVSWRSWVPPFLVVGFGLSTLGAFVTSATVGLYGVHERWTGNDVWLAAAAEVVCILAGGVALLVELRRYRRGEPALHLPRLRHVQRPGAVRY